MTRVVRWAIQRVIAANGQTITPQLIEELVSLAAAATEAGKDEAFEEAAQMVEGYAPTRSEEIAAAIRALKDY